MAQRKNQKAAPVQPQPVEEVVEPVSVEADEAEESFDPEDAAKKAAIEQAVTDKISDGTIIKCHSWGKGQGDFVLVDAADFDPEFHKEFGSK